MKALLRRGGGWGLWSRFDIANAGGNWVDEEVVVCPSGANVLVTSRNPDDLKAFCDKLIQVFGHPNP